MSLNDIHKRLQSLASPEYAAVSQRFFKTGPGQYGEGDVFIGIRVPALRKLVPGYCGQPLPEITRLLHSPIHEARMLALLILVRKFAAGNGGIKKNIYHLYLKNTAFINNWDLVDCSAEHVIGAYLWDKSRAPLYRLARSKDLWERRIAILSTFHYIKHDAFDETLALSRLLLADPEDLIQKAVGWMLREVGKRHLESEKSFLKKHYRAMPRTMLRYAIEKFPEPQRQRYLKGTI